MPDELLPIHIIKCAGEPTIAPTEVGQHWVDTISGDHFLSNGTDNVTNWVLVGSIGTTFTTFLSLLDTPSNFSGNAQKVPIVNNTEDGLIFGQQSMTNLGDVDLSGIQDIQVLEYDLGTQTFKPDFRVRFGGVWQAGTYKKSDMVTDSGWLMLANVETTDRAAPEPSGASAWQLVDNPTWASAQTNPMAVQGLRFTVSEFSTIDGYRFWRATNTGDEDYAFIIKDVTDPANEVILASGNIPGGAVGWVEVVVTGSFFYEGQIIDIQYITQVSTGSSQWTHTWSLQDTSGGTPVSGTYTHNVDHTVLRINKFADGPVDVSTDLNLLKVGDEILMFEFSTASRFDVYQVAGDFDLAGDVYDVPVVRIQNGQSVRVGNLVQADATIKSGLLPADYVSIANYWALNPPVGGGTANGYLKTSIDETPSLNSDAYGVDVRGYTWDLSDDWDVLAVSFGGGGGGGGGGGATDFLALVDTPGSYSGQASKKVVVRGDELALEFVDDTGQVSSVHTRTGDVVSQVGDYSASQVGAYTTAQTDTEITDGIAAHVALPDPHTQYLLPSDLPSISISYMTGVTSSLDGAYLLQSLTTLGNVENSVNADGVTQDVPVLVGQWVRDTLFAEDGTLLETGSLFTLDYEADNDFTDVRLEIGVRTVGGGSYNVLASQDFTLSEGRSTSTFEVTVPETNFVTDETTFVRIYVIKKEAGGTKNLIIYMEGTYVTRILTDIPGQAFPAPHATSHEVGGSDQVAHDNLTGAQGYNSHATIDLLSGINTSIGNQNATDILPLQNQSPPAYDKVNGKYLTVELTGVDATSINNTGSYGSDGTFRFTQISTTGSGQGVTGNVTISGGLVTGVSLIRMPGSGYILTELVTISVPDAGPIGDAVIQVDGVKATQLWGDAPPAPVDSVFGRTGAVVSATNDYDADQIDDASTVKKFATQAELDQIGDNQTDIANKPDNFLELDDTPADYSGSAGLSPVVNTGEDALVYAPRAPQLLAPLVISVDHAGGGDYTNLQSAFNYAASFVPGPFLITINVTNLPSLTDGDDAKLVIVGGSWAHITIDYGNDPTNPDGTNTWLFPIGIANPLTGTQVHFATDTKYPLLRGRVNFQGQCKRMLNAFGNTYCDIQAFWFLYATATGLTGTGDVGVQAAELAVVNADGANASGCNYAFRATNSSNIYARLAIAECVKWGFRCEKGSKVVATAMDFVNGFDSGPLVPALAKGGGYVDNFCEFGSIVNADSQTNTSGDEYSKTPNLIDSDGIIFV